jgi:hypothetical protein
VADQHQREPVLPPEPLEQRDDLVTGVLVEVASRLVGQQHPRVFHQGPRDRHPLLLPAGELGRQVPGAVGQPHEFQCPRRALAPLGGADAQRHERGLHVLVRAERGDQVEGLEDEAERAGPHPPDRAVARPRQIGAPEPDVAGGGPVEAAEQLQQRRLAMAGLALDGEPLPLADLKAQVTDGEYLLVPLVVDLADAGQVV